MDTNSFPIPSNLEEIRALFQQFEGFVPEEKRQIIWDTLNDLEASGGIRDEAHGRELLISLLGALGMPPM